MDMKVVFPGGKRVDAEIDGFTIKTDQAVQGGGEGSEPEPFTLFFASIATCAGIYVLSFCQHRGLSTEGVSLTMSTEVDPVKRMIGKVKINIIVPDAFPQKYHAPLIRSAGQCAVAKHIEETLPVFDVGVLTESEVS
ncbi:MAG: OsmC family protein [Candidatus Sabulitectum sp.]|nr:OsmC family protein [Candidatus Sabulitectum sp.]